MISCVYRSGTTQIWNTLAKGEYGEGERNCAPVRKTVYPIVSHTAWKKSAEL